MINCQQDLCQSLFLLAHTLLFFRPSDSPPTSQADCIQQSGIWALSTSNDFIGNRVSNHYNAIYFQSTEFKDGRLGTDSLGRVCPIHSAWGRVKGNVCHSNQRFGFYPGSLLVGSFWSTEW